MQVLSFIESPYVLLSLIESNYLYYKIQSTTMTNWQFYIFLDGLVIIMQLCICILYYLANKKTVMWKCVLYNLFCWIIIVLSVMAIHRS